METNNLVLSKDEQAIYDCLMRAAGQGDDLEALNSIGSLRVTEVTNTGLKGLVQKVIKKLLDWYMEPILEQQNAFNQKVIQVVRSMAEDH